MKFTIPDWAFGTGIAIWLALFAGLTLGCWLWGYKHGHHDGRQAERARRARQTATTAAQAAVNWDEINKRFAAFKAGKAAHEPALAHR